MSIKVGTEDLGVGKIALGNTSLTAVAVGSEKIWRNSYLVSEPTFDASDLALWTANGPSASKALANADQEIAFSTGASFAVFTIDMLSYVPSGTAVLTAIKVVSIGGGSSVRIGFNDDTDVNSAMTVDNTTSNPLPDSTTGYVFTGGVVNSTNRYLKIYITPSDSININEVLILPF